MKNFYKYFLFLFLTVSYQGVLAQGNIWSPGVSLPTVRLAPAAATINGKIYVAGGFTDQSGAFTTLEAFDPGTNNWSSLAPMPTARGQSAVGVINNIMYVVGGFGNDTTVEAYDPSTNTWTHKAHINQPRLGAAGGVINRKLYVAGGTSFDSVNTLEEYDPVTNT